LSNRAKIVLQCDNVKRALEADTEMKIRQSPGREWRQTKRRKAGPVVNQIGGRRVLYHPRPYSRDLGPRKRTVGYRVDPSEKVDSGNSGTTFSVRASQSVAPVREELSEAVGQRTRHCVYWSYRHTN